MLRSVKRREFQESFDRYCQFVEKTSGGKMKKNLWPPFRLPKHSFNNEQNITDHYNLNESHDENDLENIEKEKHQQQLIDQELVNKSDILNTKCLHAILLTILYEHYYTQPVAEKILYFVIYVLELALHLSKQKEELNETENESKFVPFEELDYETWFKSNQIKINLCTFVPFVSTKHEIVKNEDISNDPSSAHSMDHLNSDNENAKTDDSKYHSFVVPPLKKICADSKLTPNLSSNSIDADDKMEEIRTNAKTGEKFYLKKTKNYESILSLLVKIFYKNKTESLEKGDAERNSNEIVFEFLKCSYKPKEFNRIGDENDYILNLLEKASFSCDRCRLNIEKSLETLNNLNKKHPLINSADSLLDSNAPEIIRMDESLNNSISIEDETKKKKAKSQS